MPDPKVSFRGYLTLRRDRQGEIVTLFSPTDGSYEAGNLGQILEAALPGAWVECGSYQMCYMGKVDMTITFEELVT